MLPLQKKLLANRLLNWFKETGHNSWPVEETEDIISEVGISFNESAHNMWKSYDLLRLHGKIICDNNSMRLANWQPLDISQPLRIDVIVPDQLVRYCNRKGVSIDSTIDVAISHFIYEVIYKS